MFLQKVGSMSNDKLQCILPGPIKPGKSLAVPVDFDVSKLKGGQQYLDITNLEVYSKSAETQDTNPANDKGIFTSCNFKISMNLEKVLLFRLLQACAQN